MKPISIVFPFYRNQGMLARQYSVMQAEWSEEQKRRVEVIIVDDGSPERAIDVPIPPHMPKIMIFRITENRKWHQHAARNLGASQATTNWLAMFDIDHVIPPQTLDAILNFDPKLQRRAFALTFGRVDAPRDGDWRASDVDYMAPTLHKDGVTPKPHVNSFVIRKRLYWHIGGYDEDLCGIYGTDSHFRLRLWAAADQIHLSNAPVIRVDRQVIADASTTEWKRKEDRQPGEKKAAIKAALAAKAAAGRTGPTTLNFPWERQL